MTATLNRTQLHNRVQAHGQELVSNAFPFVDPATAGHDCNVATTSASVELVTGAQLSAKQCRAIAGIPGDVGTGTVLATRVFESQGMRVGVDYVRFARRDVQLVRDLLRAGWYVTLFVDYDVVNDTDGGKYAGSVYRGAHAISVDGFMRRKVDGIWRRVVWDHDPLFDGRDRPKALPDAPFGRQLVPFYVLRAAAEHYTTRHSPDLSGCVSGYAVKPRV